MGRAYPQLPIKSWCEVFQLLEIKSVKNLAHVSGTNLIEMVLGDFGFKCEDSCCVGWPIRNVG